MTERHPGFDVIAAVTLEIVTFEATSGWSGCFAPE
jgi:hypothetical protein